MITDKNTRVSTAQVVTATAVSTDSIDLLQAREIAEGEKLRAYFTVGATVTAAGAATVTFEIIMADDGALTSNVVVIGSSAPIPKANLPVGGTASPHGLATLTAVQPIVVEANPFIGWTGKRFLGVRYTIATGPLTGGNFTCDFVTDIADGKKFYPSGITIA